MKPRSQTNASLIDFQLDDFTTDQEREYICNSSSKMQAVRNRFSQPLQLLRFTHLNQESRKDYLKKLASTPEFNHPHALKFLGKVYQGSTPIGALFQNFNENLKNFIQRRHKVNTPLNTIELLWVMRQLISTLRVFKSKNYQHGNICLTNIVISRNTLYQLLFRVGDFDIQKKTEYDAKDVNSNNSLVTDIYEMGIVICQLFTLDIRQNPHAFRDRLTREADSTADKILASLLHLVLRMIDVDFSKRPEPEELEIAMATLDNDYMHTFVATIRSELIVPTESQNRIFQLANAGNAEAQYQLALLYLESGYCTQANKMLERAHLQNHARAGYILGHNQSKGIGTNKNLMAATTSLHQSAKLDDVNAQVTLAKLFLDHDKINEAQYWYARASQRYPNALGILALIERRGHIDLETLPKERPSTISVMQRAAMDGSEIAQLYVARTSLESKQTNSWLQTAASRIDLHITVRDGWYILLAVTQFNFIHPCEVMTTDEVKSWLGEYNADMIDMVQRALLFLRIPRHSNLLPIRFCANYKINELTHPLTVVVPVMQNGSMKDFLAKPENHGKAAALTLPWAFHLACALKALHDKNLVHQNISANTILINDEQQPVLAGFDRLGYSNEHPHATKSNDIFAFGLTLFELITEGKKPLELVTQCLDSPHYDELIRNQLPSSVSKELADLLLACLSPDLTKRPNAQQLIDRLMSLINHPPLPANVSESGISAEHYKLLMQVSEYNPKFASALRRDALLAGESVAQQLTKEVKQTALEIKDERIDSETKSVATPLSNSIADSDELKTSPGEALRLALYHFFELKNLKHDMALVQNLLIKASKGDPADFNTQLANIILSSSSYPLDNTCPIKYFFPVEEIILPLTELKSTPYRVPGATFQYSTKDMQGNYTHPILINPLEKNIAELLSRCSTPHENVIGPLAITVSDQINGVGLSFRPDDDVTPFNRALLSDPTTAGVRLLQLLIGVAKGLVHLHREGIVHGNVSQEYILVGNNYEGIIATGLASCRHASAPESLAYNHFSQATDYFQFGEMMMNMIIGSPWENGWSSNASEAKTEIDIKTRLARYLASADNGFADVRARIPSECRPELIDIMMRCLRLNPEQRMIASIDQVSKDLQNIHNAMFHQCVTTLAQAPKEQSIAEKKALCKTLTEYLCVFDDNEQTYEFLQKNQKTFKDLPPYYELIARLILLGQDYEADENIQAAMEVACFSLNFVEPGSLLQNSGQFNVLINVLTFFGNQSQFAKVLPLLHTFSERFSNADFEKNNVQIKEKLSNLIAALSNVAPDSAAILTEFKIKIFNKKQSEDKKSVAQIDPPKKLTQKKCEEYWDSLFENESIKESKEVVANTENSKNKLHSYLQSKKIIPNEKIKTLLKRFNGRTQFIAVTDLSAAIQEQLSIAHRTKEGRKALSKASIYSGAMRQDESKQEEQAKRSELLTLLSECEASIDVFEKADDATVINPAAIDEKIHDKTKYTQAKSQFKEIENTRNHKGPIKDEIEALKSQIQTKTMTELQGLITKFQKYAEQLGKVQNLPATIKSELGFKKKKKKNKTKKTKPAEVKSSPQISDDSPKQVESSAAITPLPSPPFSKLGEQAIPTNDEQSAEFSSESSAEPSNVALFISPTPDIDSTTAQIEWERLRILLKSMLAKNNSVSTEGYKFAFLRCLIRLFEVLPSSEEIYGEVRNLLRHKNLLAVKENIIQFTQIILKANTLETFMRNARNIVITSDLYRKLRIQVKEEKGLEQKRMETFNVDDSAQVSLRQELIECAIRIFAPILQQYNGKAQKIKPSAIPMVVQFALESLFSRCAERLDTDSCKQKLDNALSKLREAKTKKDAKAISQLKRDVAQYRFIFYCREIYRNAGHPPKECTHHHIIKAFKLLKQMGITALSDTLKADKPAVQQTSSASKSPHQALSIFAASPAQPDDEPALAAVKSLISDLDFKV